MNSQSEFAEELETAEQAAREAGMIILALYGKDYRIEEKGRGNPVTTADLEANHRIREIVMSRYPEDGWLSEENKDDLKRLNASRVWIVDPIDGTKEFIEGIPQFAVSISLAVAGYPVLGIVYNPVEETFYHAVRGSGALLNGSPIHVSLREKLQGASVLVSRSDPKRKFRLLVGTCRLQPVGSIALRLAKVAAGEGDGTLTFHRLHEWDVCAGVLIVEEAGGTVVDGAGHRLVFNQEDAQCRGLVASCGSLTQGLHEMLAQVLAEAR
ncbi:MAG: 3'(2'),5'-bisphosphate nucleotidase CysQ [Candidatus Binatia bacterium]